MQTEPQARVAYLALKSKVLLFYHREIKLIIAWIIIVSISYGGYAVARQVKKVASV